MKGDSPSLVNLRDVLGVEADALSVPFLVEVVGSLKEGHLRLLDKRISVADNVHLL